MRFKTFVATQHDTITEEKIYFKSSAKVDGEIVKKFPTFKAYDHIDEFDGDFIITDNPKNGRHQDSYMMKLVGKIRGKAVIISLGSHPSLSGAKQFAKRHLDITESVDINESGTPYSRIPDPHGLMSVGFIPCMVSTLELTRIHMKATTGNSANVTSGKGQDFMRNLDKKFPKRVGFLKKKSYGSDFTLVSPTENELFTLKLNQVKDVCKPLNGVSFSAFIQELENELKSSDN